MEFNKKIELILKKLNLSQKDFALKLGISPNAVSHYLLGKRNPDINTIQKLIDFGVSPLFLFYDFEEPFDEDVNRYIKKRRSEKLAEDIAAKEKELEELKMRKKRSIIELGTEEKN